MVGLEEVTERNCMEACRHDNSCAGLFLRAGECHHVALSPNQLQAENGTDYYKKINGSDFTSVALLQKPSDINCLKGCHGYSEILSERFSRDYYSILFSLATFILSVFIIKSLKSAS